MKILHKKLWIGAVLGALAIGAVAVAQVTPPTVSGINSTDLFQDIPNGQSAPTNVYATILQMRSFVLGQNSQHLTAPTLTTSNSGCGGSTAVVVGTDTSGVVTEGSSAETTCVITFAKAFVTAPECFVSLNNVADSSLKCATTTTAATVTQSSLASGVLNYLIVAVPGG